MAAPAHGEEINRVLSYDNNVWAFDVDVAILDVPPLAEAMATEGGACDVLYQRRAPQSPQMVGLSLLARGGSAFSSRDTLYN